MKLSNKVYDALKLLVTICTPIATFVATLGTIFGDNQVFGIIAAVIAAIGTCIGAIINESSKQYWAEEEK